ncbi:MAG: M48 family metalloprotease [Wolbachia endosymbiont of Meromenopon meropis]|nr:M48 family metalloprotease [Wolbachia endosymbiont of Meromenopon meropis]
MFKVASFFVLYLFFVYCSSSTAYPANVIRDSEVETIVKELAQPLFSASGIDVDLIKVFVISDNSVNAFVINNNIFIHLGLLQYSTEPYILLGILAHEIAHISASHILHINRIVNYFQSITMISYIAGLISTIINDLKFASVILFGSVSISSKLFFDHSQNQEKVADSYALKYLDESGYDNLGMKEIFKYFKSIEQKNSEIHFRTHPPSDKRILAVQNYKIKNNIKPIFADKLLKFKRIITKLDSLFSPMYILSDKYQNNSEYVNAIIYCRQGKMKEAINIIDSLIQKSPNNPYLYEVMAKMLYKTGNLNKAIKMYEKSLRYLSEKDSYLIKLTLSHTLLLHGDLKKAIFYLEQIANIEQNNILVWKYLSIAYKCSGDIAMHFFALTKKAFIENNLKQFTKYAELAVKALPKDSPYSLQIEDMRHRNT